MSTQRLRVLVTPQPTEISRELVRGHLYEALALDTEGAVVPLKATDLEVMELTAAEGFALADARLARTSAVSDLRPVDTVEGLRFLVASDGLAASRLRLLPWLLRGAIPFGGLVAGVPGPDQLMVVPLDSVRALDALQVLASAVGAASSRQDCPLSDQLFWFDGERWRPLPVHHAEQDITVLPPRDFVRAVNSVAAMDLVRVTAEA